MASKTLPGSAEQPVHEPHMTSEAMEKGSGKGWAEWLQVLDAWGAYEKTHMEIARYVNEELGVDGWWAQGVTVGYERIRGKRETGQRVTGTYAGTASKTINLAVEDIQPWWVEDALRDQWLAPGTLKLRTHVPGKSARFDNLESGGIVGVYLTTKSDTKATVALEQEKLPSKEAAAEFRATWKPRLDNLAKEIGR